jgi:hypothetical protein
MWRRSRFHGASQALCEGVEADAGRGLDPHAAEKADS